MSFNLERPKEDFNKESFEERRRLQNVITEYKIAGDDIIQQFRIMILYIGNYSKDIKDLVLINKLEEAYYKWYTLKQTPNVCGIPGCLYFHPLLLAIWWNDKNLIEFMFQDFHKIFLKECDCIPQDQMIYAISLIISEDTSKYFKHKYPELAIYVSDALVKIENREKHIKTFELVVNSYYKSGSDKDKQRIIDILGKIDNDTLSNEQLNCLFPYIGNNKVNRICELYPSMKLCHKSSIIDYLTSYSEYLIPLKPFMTQAQKNKKLWECSAQRSDSLTIDNIKQVLDLGGDVYSTDPKGISWIICILAGSCWGNINDAVGYPARYRQNAFPILDVFMYENRNSKLLQELYLLAKSYDVWHIDTHKHRSIEFKNITICLLLCIKRLLGYSLPKLVIISIMKHVTLNMRSNISINSDELERAEIFSLRGFYLYLYDSNVKALLITRNISRTTDNKYGNAKLLAEHTRKDILRSGMTVSTVMDKLITEAKRLETVYKENEIRDILFTLDYTRRNNYLQNSGNIYRLKPSLKLAFHNRFGFDKILNFPVEAQQKRQKYL
jgi:hypothetical protein